MTLRRLTRQWPRRRRGAAHVAGADAASAAALVADDVVRELDLTTVAEQPLAPRALLLTLDV